MYNKECANFLCFPKAHFMKHNLIFEMMQGIVQKNVKNVVSVSVRITEPKPNRNCFGFGLGFGRKFRFRSFTRNIISFVGLDFRYICH